jgi:hypothetical protein
MNLLTPNPNLLLSVSSSLFQTKYATEFRYFFLALSVLCKNYPRKGVRHDLDTCKAKKDNPKPNTSNSAIDSH